jgi:hypothetical protein
MCRMAVGRCVVMFRCIDGCITARDVGTGVLTVILFGLHWSLYLFLYLYFYIK